MNQISRPRIMTIAEIKHFHNGECIWSQQNIPNMWHTEGQEFLLAVAFDTDGGFAVPSNYYIGLDNRTTVAASDNLLDLTGEPTTNGYHRQTVSSTTGFTVASRSGVMTATSAIITFSATTGSWGPVRNVFLSTSGNAWGYLIATAALSAPRTVATGDSMTVRLNLSFASCP